jgi:hypothetical protein
MEMTSLLYRVVKCRKQQQLGVAGSRVRKFWENIKLLFSPFEITPGGWPHLGLWHYFHMLRQYIYNEILAHCTIREGMFLQWHLMSVC